MSYCYLLFTNDLRQTYIGATVDPSRRLRQHNQELVGGARKTKGRVWKRALYVGGFPDWVDALQFEWSWKRHGNGKPGLAGKLQALLNLLQSEKSTSTATPFRFWPGQISIHPEPETIHIVEKIESFRRLVAVCGRLNSNLLPFFTLPSFFLSFFSFLSLHPTMSTSTLSEQISALALQVEDLSTTVAQLVARLDVALSKDGAAIEAPGAPKKKRGPKKAKVEVVPMTPLDGAASTGEAAPKDETAPKDEAAPEAPVTPPKKKRGPKPKKAVSESTTATPLVNEILTTEATTDGATSDASVTPKKKRGPKKAKAEPVTATLTVDTGDAAPSTPKKRGPKKAKVEPTPIATLSSEALTPAVAETCEN